MYKRYELYCEGEAQGVGLLMGIDELEMDNDEKEVLIDDFNDNLIVPEFYKQAHPDREVLAFFTKEGDEYFSNSLKTIIDAFNEQGLYHIAEVLAPEKGQTIIYKDDFQVLIKKPKSIEIKLN